MRPVAGTSLNGPTDHILGLSGNLPGRSSRTSLMSGLPERFKIENELGRGGMGVVYKAHDSAYGRTVAVKVLPDNVLEDELLYRFRREGSDMAGLSHPNVVHCFEYGIHEGKDFIVMEYINGGNLRHFVKNSDNLADIVSAYCAICEGLEHIHGQGIVHRDLKPGNILFTDSGMPKIADFGISRRVDSDTQLTQVGTIMGTSAFVAPEMIVSSSTVTPSADIYALGVCLFESLTGQLPITGETEYAILNAHLNQQPLNPSELRADIPPSLDLVALQMLAKSPSDRPSSAKEAGRLLRDCLRDSLQLAAPEILQTDDEPTEPTATGQELEGLITVDPQGRIESCNPDAALLLGHTSMELFGQPVERFLPKMRTLTKRADELSGQTYRMEGRKRVEQSIPLEVTVQATDSARGRQLSVNLRAGEPDVETLASNLVKSGQFDFLTRMSHEIWTPMNGILGMARLTRNTDLDADQRRYMKDLESSAERLHEVLQTAFDFSRLGDGSLSLEPVPINVRQFLDAMLKPYSFEASARGLEFNTQIDPLVPDNIVADPNRLRQILRHLLQNALKFTEKGGIGLTVGKESGDDHVVELRFSVSDTGQGLLPGREKLIFRPFYQEDTSISRKSGGVGLGLAIVQGLVAKMDGRVWVDSQRGRGSVFHLVAEFGVAEAPYDENFKLRMGALKVLLLDPGEQYQSLASVLGRWGLEVSVAGTPEQAGQRLEAARETSSPFDLVLAEVHGLHFDAYAFVKRFKLSHEAFVLFSQDISLGDAQRCRTLGVDALLDKPVNATELWDAVLKILKNGPRSRVASFGSLNILVAEDNPVNQTLATVLLTSHGHEVALAEHGLQVLERLEEDDQFDLILMDLQMPHMDGITTTKKVRADEKARGGKRLPIVALTAHVEAGALERCLEAGMDAYLNKPIDEDQLMEVIARVIDYNEVASGVMRDPKATESGIDDELGAKEVVPLPPVRDTETTNYNVVDEGLLMARVGHNSATLCQLIDIFLNLYHDQLMKVKTAIDDSDAESLRASAHKFKGSVANFSARAAAEAAEALEKLGRAGSTLGAEGEYTALVRETEILVVALRSLRERLSQKKQPSNVTAF